MIGDAWGGRKLAKDPRRGSKTEREKLAGHNVGLTHACGRHRGKAAGPGREGPRLGWQSGEALVSSTGGPGSRLSLKGVPLWANTVLASPWLGAAWKGMAAIEGWMEPPDAVATVSLAVGCVLEGDSSAPTLAAPPTACHRALLSRSRAPGRWGDLRSVAARGLGAMMMRAGPSATVRSIPPALLCPSC